MARQEENILTEAISAIKHLWRHRNGNETVAAVLDTFDNLGFITKDQRKPVLVSKKKTAYGWHLIFRLPPGISFKSVEDKRNYFQDAIPAWINMGFTDGLMHMDIQAGKLPENVKYEWDYREYIKMDIPIPIGFTQKGVEVLDLARAPHLLIGGVPGY